MAARRPIVPEVIQTSAMDCGPACLTSLLAGFGIRASYERLREACQTDVDGTSIDTIEEAASRLGLKTEQIMVPADYLLALAPNPLPGIAVVRHPNGLTHFVVVWTHGFGFVQIMDPAVGRIWRTETEFLNTLYVHRMTVPVSAWRDWARSESFLAPLRRKMSELGCRSRQIRMLLTSVLADPGWRPLASLEACVRALERLVDAGAFRRGREASRALEHLLRDSEKCGSQTVPDEFWSVRAAVDRGEEEVTVQGVVLVTVRGRDASSKPGGSVPGGTEPLPSALDAVLNQPALNPARALWQSLWRHGKLLMAFVAFALCLAAGGVIGEAILLRGLVDVFADFKLAGEQLAVIGTVVTFILSLMLVDYSIAAWLNRLGRRVEAEFRLAISTGLPRIADSYFRSRLASDMAQRAHSTHRLRMLPQNYSQFIRGASELVITAAAIIWLEPSALTLTLLAVGFNLGLPLLCAPIIRERDLKMRNHVGALTRFYLDAMLGLTPLRTHGAERAFRREHKGVLREWSRSALSLQTVAVVVDGLQLVAGFGFAALLVGRLAGAPEAGAALLLLYWALKVPMLAQDLALTLRQYPAQRNVALRVLEPLGARLEAPAEDLETQKTNPQTEKTGVAIDLEGINVEAQGHAILKGITLRIAPGTHVGIVGASGAGKSSLVGLLLGLQRPAAGKILVDGEELASGALARLRRETAWIDPSVQLWNRSLLENLQYGSNGRVPDASLIEEADLLQLLASFPEGMQTRLGENGGIVSGGEGQRVRLGRAMLKGRARLVVLDEPFRGLERTKRRALLANARKHWQWATMLCVTHDIAETLALDRVLVIESGEIVEDGCPRELSQRAGSRFQSMLAQESELRRSLWGGQSWRRLRLERGRVTEQEQARRAVAE
ncbi:MAG: ATP-binding cassette domain-containing protein [Acidobacteria bacterium]|nr:ATP-binding cassette domain-containing protein [Acidobacteriota bacterium]